MNLSSPKRDYDRANRAADKVREQMQDRGLEPNLLETASAVVLGSGLQEEFPEKMGSDRLVIPYHEIPLLEENNSTTAPGHHHQLVIGPLEGDEKHLVTAFLGRYHLYEDLSADACTFYVRLVKALGIDVLGITNAAGILNDKKIQKGEVVMIDDIMNETGASSLHGPTEAMWGEPFTSMKTLLPAHIIEKARYLATEVLRWPGLASAIYVQDRGLLRRYQTASEAKALRNKGGDLVGKSTAIELEVAVDAGISGNFAMSLATNYAYGIRPDLQGNVTSDHVVDEGKKNAAKFGDLLSHVLKSLYQQYPK